MMINKILKNSSLNLMSLVLTALIVVGGLYFYMIIRLPDVAQLKEKSLQMPLRIYSSDGKLIGEFGEKKRIPISIDQVPKPLIQALLDTEDQRFYEHRGVDFIGLLRAAVVLVESGKKTQGASTITMQVARDFFLNREKTYGRKINEILLALKIDNAFSKDEILDLYLNNVYLGQRAYGVEAGAQVYFGKSVKDLTLPQLAVLAGLPQAPSRDNPLVNMKSALERRNHVLQRMLENGHIDIATYNAAIATPIKTSYHELQTEVQAPYIAEMARNEVISQFGEDAYDIGIKVYTTIDSHLQEAANKALQDGILAYDKRHGYSRPGGIEGAIVALDPKNGAILALSGGFSYTESNFNRAIQAGRQTGSGFKPFIYSAAFDKNFTLASMINDAPVVMNDPATNTLWRPQNDTQKFYGPTRLRIALTQSRNVVSIRLLQAIGIPYTVDYLQKFGFEGNAEVPPSPSLALGTGVITPIKIAAGYATFANSGYKITPYFINSVVDQKNKLLLQTQPETIPEVLIPANHNPAAPRVITPQNAYIVTSALKDVIETGTAKKALLLRRQDLAGKTGTTNDQIDAWFSGYNSDIVTTVWMGFDQPQTTHEHGAQAALPVWMQFMEIALLGKPEHTMQQPEGIITTRIDPSTGLLAQPGQKDSIFEVFIKGTEPSPLEPQPADTMGGSLF